MKIVLRGRHDEIVGRALGVVLAVLSGLGCTHARAVTFGHSEDAITVQKPALYPETVEYNHKHDRFVVGSFREGAIYEVDGNGVVTLFVEDHRLCSVLGLAVDDQRGRLWAVSSDMGASIHPSAAGPRKAADVGVYDLSTGAPITYVDVSGVFSGPHLLNGIAIDRDGNAYVTDSFSPVIYKVDASGVASVFIRSDQFAGDGINLNGLVVHPDGYLLVVKKSNGALFKVPLANPSAFSQVKIGQSFVGGDGVLLIGKKDLVIVANKTPSVASNAAFALSSDDGWDTAKVGQVEPLGDVYPTTAVMRNGQIYVLYTKLNELIQLPQDKKAGLREEAKLLPIGAIVP
jgi:hypothetical protein